MLSLTLTICFAFSLIGTVFAIPTQHNAAIPTPKDSNPSSFSPPTLPTLRLANNLTTSATWRPACWSEDPDPDPMEKANPITHPADCFQAVLQMLSEGSDRELLVWDQQRGWTYESCGLFLLPTPGLPIHRDTFSRNDVAQCAESIRLACVNEKHGFRGGLSQIAAGVFQVAVAGKPGRVSLGRWEEGIGMNVTAVKKKASIFRVRRLGSSDVSHYTKKVMANYLDVKSGFCAIGDDFCAFKDSNGTIIEAVTTNFSDQCLLWDASCSGNRTLAIDKFFNVTFSDQFSDDPNDNGNLMDNDCFSQDHVANQSDCDTYNPPKRLSDFQKIRNWMRSPQCVSAANEWTAMTGYQWRSIFGFNESKPGWLTENAGGDPNDGPGSGDNYSSEVLPSCCGLCDAQAQNVDLYYWPEPDANTSCLSIIGESVRPLDYGATTTIVKGIGGPVTEIYWGCNALESLSIEDFTGEAGTLTTAYTTAEIRTAEITTIGSLTVKISSVSPWSSSPCIKDDAGSQGSNKSIKIRELHASIHTRGHSSIVPSSITEENGLPVSTVISGDFTFTSPSIYANIYGLSASDACGGSIMSPTMLSFSAGELSTIEGFLAYYVGPGSGQSTKQFDFGDLPCPPQSIMEANWYKPQPGEPYRPLIAMPSKLKEINPWFSYCSSQLFTAYDPPSALTAATALAPPIPPSHPKVFPWTAVSSPTLGPGARQTVGAKASIPVPASIPILDQPKATINAAPAPPKKEGPDPRPQPNDAVTQESPSSLPQPNKVVANSDPEGSNNPQQNSDPQQTSDPKQGNNSKQDNGDSGNSGQEADPNQKSDPNQIDSNQGSNDRADPVPQSDPKQTDGADNFNLFTGGQAKTINHQIVQPLSHGISIAGTTLILGAPPVTVSDTPINLGSSALVIGTSTVPLGSGNPTPIITTIAGHVITAAPNAIAVAGTTLTRGAPPITVSGTPIHFGSSALAIGTSTVPLVSPTPEPIITTIAGQTVTAVPNVVVIAGSILSPGGPDTTIDGTILSLDTAGQFVVGSKTMTLASKVPATVTTTIAGQLITAAPNAIAVAGTTLFPGAPGMTLDRTLLSLDTASQLIVGSKTIILVSSSRTSILTTIGGQVITAAPNRIAIAGTTLTPGASAVTLGGTLVSLNTAGQLVVGSDTMTLQSGSTGLDGLIMGAFGSGGPFGLFSTNLPSPTQGSVSTGAGNSTSTGVQVFSGNAASLKDRYSWIKITVSVIAMSVLVYIC
ncbi:MAG: hypothetical protein ASARMPREDX12_003327 [Alectoria sarmentosa]|nr:MAG: hypothetical protein ASARMPREDX12_003327 [Alectoria sarmentosa]